MKWVGNPFPEKDFSQIMETTFVKIKVYMKKTIYCIGVDIIGTPIYVTHFV
jgi:hypothetical protein